MLYVYLIGQKQCLHFYYDFFLGEVTPLVYAFFSFPLCFNLSAECV